jgi:serine/threonine protein kinase
VVQQLGKYQLVAEIARGGMGVVSLAVATGPARFSKLLVVKELKPELVEDASFLEMFLEEARLAARLNHPNIVQTYEIGAEGKRHFMVMDYLEGVTLSSVLRKKGDAFTLPMHIRVLCETLQALDYAHNLKDFDGSPLGIVHRDATPQNVFLTFDGTVKLVDFGIAKALDSVVETRAGVLKGKPAYMAPEQITGTVDARADIFSIGVMLWEAIVGRRMWHKKGDVEILTKIIKGEIPTLKETKPFAPPELIRICDRAIAKTREERYATAAELQGDLEAYLYASKTDISPRDVAKVVATLFASDRAKTKDIIEKHIASIKSGAALDLLPTLRPASEETLATPSSGAESGPRLPEPVLTPSSPSIGTTPGATAIPSAHDALAKDVAANRKNTVVRVAVVAAILAAGGLLAARFGQPAVPAVNPAASVSAAPLPTFIVPIQHEVSLRAMPATARISIEGVPLSNPGVRTCIQGQHVTMHVSAAHYLSTDRELICDKDETIEVALEPEPTVAPSASVPAPPPRPQRVAPAPQAPPPLAPQAPPGE